MSSPQIFGEWTVAHGLPGHQHVLRLQVPEHDLLSTRCVHVGTHLAMGQNPNRTPSEHPHPHKQRPKWVVHLPHNGIIGFDPQPFEPQVTLHQVDCCLDISQNAPDFLGMDTSMARTGCLCHLEMGQVVLVSPAVTGTLTQATVKINIYLALATSHFKGVLRIVRAMVHGWGSPCKPNNHVTNCPSAQH